MFFSLEFEIHSNDSSLQVDDFLALANKVWPNLYDIESTQNALTRTINVTARHSGQLIGCARLLTDGYFFAVVTEILVDPTFQSLGVGRKLLDALYKESPCSIFLGAQAVKKLFLKNANMKSALHPIPNINQGGSPVEITDSCPPL